METNEKETSILELRDISKSFDGKKVLDNLTLSIGKNEFITLLGPSAYNAQRRALPTAGRPQESDKFVFSDRQR